MWWGGGLVTGVAVVGVGCAGRTGSAADSVDGEAGGTTQLVGDGGEGGVGSSGEVTTSNRGKPAGGGAVKQVGVVTGDAPTNIGVLGAYQVVDSGGGAVACLSFSGTVYTMWDVRYEISSLLQPVVEWSVEVIQVDSSRMRLRASFLMRQKWC